jgi:cytochrome c-type biogenesis protein
MEYLPIAFFAGILTVLAPCVLPVLPVIISGSLQERDPFRPVIITLSLGLSIVIFTLLLKVSTIFVDIPQSFWQILSGTIIFFFGIITVWPGLWEKVSHTCGLSGGSHKLLHKASKTQGRWGMVLLGASLGPVFASCSPVYFIILATILPANFFVGLINLIAYGLGLAAIMFVIAYFGQKAISRARWAADPMGWFRRGLGVLFLIVGLAILTGLDKKAEIWVLDQEIYTGAFEEQLVERLK